MLKSSLPSNATHCKCYLTVVNLDTLDKPKMNVSRKRKYFDVKISVFSVKITWSCQSENTAKTNLIARDANATRIVFENHKIGINKRSFKKIFFSALLMPCLLKVFYSSTPNPSSISPSRSPSSPVVLSV